MDIANDGFGRDSDDESGTQDTTPVTQYYFLGNEIESNPVDDAMLILRHGPPDGDDSTADERTWSVLKCKEAIEVPRELDMQVCVYEESAVVETDEVYQSHIAWVLTKDEIDDLGNADDIVHRFPFPAELRDDVIPQQTEWDEDELESLLLPFSV